MKYPDLRYSLLLDDSDDNFIKFAIVIVSSKYSKFGKVSFLNDPDRIFPENLRDIGGMVTSL